MTDPQLPPSNPRSLRVALWLMSCLGLFALAYVIVQSISVPKNNLTRFAEGSLAKLTVLPDPPLQSERIFIGPDGDDVKLSDFRGKYVLLNVWATWCAPCIAEIPSLDSLQKEYGSETFEVVAVSVDTQRIVAEGFLKSNKVEHLRLYSDNTMGLPSDVGAPGLPISILYEPNGIEIARIAGEVNWQSAEAQTLLRAVLQPN